MLLESHLIFKSHFEAQDALESGTSDGVVELLVLGVPLEGRVAVAVLHEVRVDRVQVLHATLFRNKFVGGVEHRHVVVFDSKREPALHHLRLDGASDVEVGVNSLDNSNGHLALIRVLLQAINEENLLVGIPGVVATEIEG